MKAKRYDAIGIKQVIRLEWMEKTASLLLAGLDSKAIRLELHEYMAERKGTGETGERSENTRRFAVNNLMRTWIEPDGDLVRFRDNAIQCLSRDPVANRAVHWAMISAAYPFWYSVARQTGRLLNLQDAVTQQQVTSRLKEQYGDRPTISRYARFVLRSFVAWGVLKDMEPKGSYGKCCPVRVTNEMLFVLVEGALHTTDSERIEWNVLLRDPALFPFEADAHIGVIQSTFVSRVAIEAYGSGERYVRLKE